MSTLFEVTVIGPDSAFTANLEIAEVKILPTDALICAPNEDWGALPISSVIYDPAKDSVVVRAKGRTFYDKEEFEKCRQAFIDSGWRL